MLKPRKNSKKDELKPRLSGGERRQRIIEAALPLFAKVGFRGVTTKQVAKGAGVSEALLYQHFPSKEDLYAEVQQFCCAPSSEFSRILGGLTPSTKTLVQLLFLMVKVIVEGATFSASQDPLFPRLMLHSLLDDGAFARLHFAQGVNRMAVLIKSCLETARRTGDLAPGADEGDDELLFWFCHHTIVATHMLKLPTSPVLPYHNRETAELTAPMLRYMLRGIGLTPQAITQYVQFDELNAAITPWLVESGQRKGSR